jgi:hypothetical protein
MSINFNKKIMKNFLTHDREIYQHIFSQQRTFHITPKRERKKKSSNHCTLHQLIIELYFLSVISHLKKKENFPIVLLHHPWVCERVSEEEASTCGN